MQMKHTDQLSVPYRGDHNAKQNWKKTREQGAR